MLKSLTLLNIFLDPLESPQVAILTSKSIPKY